MTLPEVLYLAGMYWLIVWLVLCICKRILP